MKLFRLPSARSASRAIAALACLAAPSLLAAKAPSATVSLVLRKSAPTDVAANDAAVVRRLETLGYRVRVVDEGEPASATEGSGAILISASVSGYNLASKYRDTAIPVITWEPAILPYMAMTGRRAGADYGEAEGERRLWLVNAPHRLGGGVPAGHQLAYAKGEEMGWGKPGLGATVIATIPGEPEKATEFSYERGATMDDDSLAPARRLFMFISSGSFIALTPTGLQLFDAAVRWSVEGAGCRAG